MIDGEAVLALIPARGGSKGVPRKNLAPLCGRPLISWTIAAARASKHLDRLIVSSDDEEIIAACRTEGCEAPFVRPAELAGDEARSIDVIHHAMRWIESESRQRYGYLVLLQPTSPLRAAADIDRCLQACHYGGAPAAVTVTEPDHSPFWMYAKDELGRLSPLITPPAPASRRQDLPRAFRLNGAVYAARWDKLRRWDSFMVDGVLGVDMPPERSVDIDRPLDLRLAELLIAEGPAAPVLEGAPA